MVILAIESSCDEFAVSIIKDNKILTNIVASQIQHHQQFGGVVPELAARLHLENLDATLSAAIREAQLGWDKINYIAYTCKPGLIGSLIIGKLVAETLASYYQIPLLPVDHIQGHIFGALINQRFAYPILAMVVSGGHTQIQLVHSPHHFEIVGQTVDDAIGECYDKVARVLGMPYPGGPEIDKAARIGNADAFAFSLPKDDHTYDFSYSGLKTNVVNLVHNLHQKHQTINIADVSASFQKTATSIIAKKLERALQAFKPQTLTIAGGVSANSALRRIIHELGAKHRVKYCFVPEMQYCTDNAAMIAKLAYEQVTHKEKIPPINK